MGNQWAAWDKWEHLSSMLLTQKSKYHPRTEWSDGGDWRKGWEAPDFTAAQARIHRVKQALEKELHACFCTSLAFQKVKVARPGAAYPCASHRHGIIVGLPQPWACFPAWLLQFSSEEQVRGMNFAKRQWRHRPHTEHPALTGMATMPQRSPGSRGCAGRTDGKRSFYKGGDNKKHHEIKLGERKLSFVVLTLFRGSSHPLPSGDLFLNNYWTLVLRLYLKTQSN